ncbi:hypothetical protein BH23VER1_BH23VER1_21950 [soil metagenome]
MPTTQLLTALVGLVIALAAHGALAADSEARAWGALVYLGPGEVEGLKEPSPNFEAVRSRLGQVFPDHPKSTLIAQHTQEIFKEYESWVVPSKELYLKIDSRGRDESGGMRLDIQVWRDDKVLLKTNAVLSHERPLFVGGPKWRGGRLVFVIMLL